MFKENNKKRRSSHVRDERRKAFVVPPWFRLAVLSIISANPSLPDTLWYSVLGISIPQSGFTVIPTLENSGGYPVLSNGGRSEWVLLVHARTFAHCSQAHSTTAWCRFSPTPTLYNLGRSYTLPVRCFKVFSCLCGKYTKGFVVCQVFTILDCWNYSVLKS